MAPILAYLLPVIAFAATCIALRGDTWNSRHRGLRKLTVTGYLALGIGVVGLVASLLQVRASARDRQLRRSDAHNAVLHVVREMEGQLAWAKLAEHMTGGTVAAISALQHDHEQLGQRLEAILQLYADILSTSERSLGLDLRIALVEGPRLFPQPVLARLHLQHLDSLASQWRRIACPALLAHPDALCPPSHTPYHQFLLDSANGFGPEGDPSIH